MQTFLPFADFAESARVLDQARLGKQRVEALQVLRALALPDYGWQTHPVTRMWTGYVPALTRYALDTVDAWTAEGRADSTRPLIAEFAPQVDDPQIRPGDLDLPSWFGDEDLHRSHRSNLIRKFPEFYRPLFPDVPDDLPYVWPGTDPGTARPEAAGPPWWIARPADEDRRDEWLTTGTVTLAEASPRGATGGKWARQLEDFAAQAAEGDAVAVPSTDQSAFRTGRIVGRAEPFSDEHGAGLRRAVEFTGEVRRSDFPHPALLQDPKSFFRAPGPAYS